MSYVPGIENLTRTTNEIVQPEVVEIQGKLPPWLKGSYFRNGPGKWEVSSDFYMKHLFDGFALVSKFDIQDGKVALTQKYLQSQDYLNSMRVGRPLHLGFGTKSYPDPNKKWFSRLVSNLIPQETTDNCNTGIYRIGNDLFTGVDGTFFFQVDTTTLKTIGRHDSSKLFGLNVMAPKPNVDPVTDTVYNVGSFLSTSGVKHGIIQIPGEMNSCEDAFKKSKLVASWPSRWPGCCHYTHTFGMTKNYFVVIDQPYLASITSLAANVVKGKPMVDLFEFRPKDKNRFFLVDRSTGKVLKTEYMSEETFFYFYVINCYEDNNHMVVDVMAYDDTSNFDAMYVDKLRENMVVDSKACEARRYVFPIAEEIRQWQNEEDDANLVTLPNVRAKAFKIGNQVVCRPQSLTNTIGLEGPSINQKFLGKKYKYFYVHPSFHMNYTNKVGKVCTETGEITSWTGTDTQFPSEPLFVPNPSAVTEDDGVVMVTVTETNLDEKSFLLFLDAKSMSEIARAEFHNNVPMATEGVFVPAK